MECHSPQADLSVLTFHADCGTMMFTHSENYQRLVGEMALRRNERSSWQSVLSLHMADFNQVRVLRDHTCHSCRTLVRVSRK